MKSNNWGRIVNISSIWGHISKEFRASYSASKFGLDGMTISISAEFAQYGILDKKKKTKIVWKTPGGEFSTKKAKMVFFFMFEGPHRRK